MSQVPHVVLAVVVNVLLLSTNWFALPQLHAASASGRSTLVRLPEDAYHGALSITEDGRGYAFVRGTRDRCRMVYRGREGPWFAECGAARFAPGSQDLYYWALPLVPSYMRMFNWIRHWGKPPKDLPVLVYNEAIVAPGLPQPVPLIFARDGTRWAVAGRLADPVSGVAVEGRVGVFADGRVLGEYAEASWPVFNPDGTQLAYLIRTESGAVELLVDGHAVRVFEKPDERVAEFTQADRSGMSQQLRLTYLSDGKLLAIAPSREGWAVYLDDQVLASFRYNIVVPEAGVEVRFAQPQKPGRAIVGRLLAVAEQAPVVAWWERLPGDDERWRVVRNDRPEDITCARYSKHIPPLLSADGQHIAYACHQSSEGERAAVTVVVDGKEFGPYRDVWAMTFSPDGQRLAYAASDGSPYRDWSYYVDGRPLRKRFQQVWSPRFDPTGAHIAWQAQSGSRPLLFLDGRPIRSFDDVLWGPSFSPETVSWVVRRKQRLLRVDVPLR